MKKYLAIIILLFLSMGYSYGQEDDSIVKPTDDELLAAQFFQNKEFDKAAALYGKLYNSNQSPFYYNNYLNCLIELKDYSDAEKVIKKRIRKAETQSIASLQYKVDLGYIYQRANQMSKAEKEFESVIKGLKGDYQETVDVANAFLIRNMSEYAINSYIRSRNILKDNNIFNLELAGIYEKTGNYQDMTDEYLNLVENNRSMLEEIENKLQIVLTNDPDNKKNEILKKSLIKRIQQNPDNSVFAELMLWQAIQNKDFDSALQQAKTLNRLFKEQGNRIYNLAQLCNSNKEYSIAEDAYEYIIKKGKDNPFFLKSNIELLNVKYQRIIHTFNYSIQDIKNLENDYITSLNEFGKSSSTISLIKNLAHIQAFYLDKYKEASIMLNETTKLQQLTSADRAECKMELADILLMSGEVWEATLLYSQVEKEFKFDTIGYSAKFKNAKLFYYIGEFKWAKAQLDILKAATSKLIANDAMELYLLINDNVDWTDSSATAELPLKMYAKADLYTFQNKDELALLTLDSILQLYSEHSICDRTLYKKAEIKLKQGKYDEADTLLGTIVAKYSYSVMVDDALFKMAEINQFQYKNKGKAMNLYEKLLKDYPSSIYAVDARKRFRQLRGDYIQ